jgi:hypothetical protein
MDFKGIINRLRDARAHQKADRPFDEFDIPVPELDAAPPPPAPDPVSPMPDPASETGRRKRTGIAGLGTNEDPDSGPAPANRVVQNAVDDSAYQARARQIEHIHALFGDYSNRTCTYLLTQSLMDGGMARLVERLGMRPRGRDGADMAQIAQWLTENGEERFCRAVGVRLSGDTGPVPPPITHPASAPDPATPPGVRVQPLGTRSASSSRPPKPAPRTVRDPSSTGTGASHRTKVSFTPVSLKPAAEDEGHPPASLADPPSKNFMYSPKSKPPEKK